LRRLPVTGFLLFLSFFYAKLFANDTIQIKKGVTVGALPVLAYDTDFGLKYGGVINVFQFGKGETFPDYKHSFFLEFNNTSARSSKLQFRYDSKYLIPYFRFTFSAGIFNDKAMKFYGFNGYQSYIDYTFSEPGNSHYISSMYYKYQHLMKRVNVDFITQSASPYKFLFGSAFYNFQLSSVDVSYYNKMGDSLPSPHIIPGLYENFINWGFINEKEKNGGNCLLVKVGGVYDTRDLEPNPMKGIFTEALIISGLQLNQKSAYLQFAFTHRQYIKLMNNWNLAYRLSVQQVIAGIIPFYLLPYLHSSQRQPVGGLGGYYTLRGVEKNRAVGKGYTLMNLESRYAFYHFKFRKNYFYIASSVLFDVGRIISYYPYQINDALSADWFQKGKNESWHSSSGLGLHLSMNQYFIISCNYAKAFHSQDGRGGWYVDMDFLF